MKRDKTKKAGEKQLEVTASSQLEKIAQSIGASAKHVATVRATYGIPLVMIADVFEIAKQQGGKPEKVAELVQRGIQIYHVDTVYDIRDSFVNDDTRKEDSISLGTIADFVLHFEQELEDPDEITDRLRRIMGLREEIGELYFGAAVKEFISISELTGFSDVEYVLNYVESSRLGATLPSE